jgi:hypothetical protein
LRRLFGAEICDPAETWASVVVKARIAAEHLHLIDPEQSLLDDILVNLIADILRISGEKPKRHTSWHK